jgi:putative ABC transport system permease protein
MIILQVRVPGIDTPVNLAGLSSVNLNSVLGEIKVAEGSMYIDAPAPQALIGYSVAYTDSGQSRYVVSQPLLVQVQQRSVMLTVTGIMESYGSSPLIQPDSAIFLPIDYLKMMARLSGYNFLVVKANTVEEVDAVTELLNNAFGSRASVTSIKQVSETVTGITNQISILLFGIAGTSFIAAGLGTFNIMMVSVLERVREIGILKSLGMKDEGILALYVTQGALVGVLGSLTGLGLGVALAYVLPGFLGSANFGGVRSPNLGASRSVNVMTDYSPIITFENVAFAMSISLLVTLISSAYPAWRASQMRPVEALRYE